MYSASAGKETDQNALSTLFEMNVDRRACRFRLKQDLKIQIECEEMAAVQTATAQTGQSI